MKTLKEAKIAAWELKGKHIASFPRLIVWIEKEANKFVVFHNLSGRMQPNPLQKKRIFIN